MGYYIIAENQGAFIHGRFIAHNVMVCQDIVHGYGRKNSKPGCIIKMDVKKAYDSIDWRFMEDMLRALEFPDNFVQLVMECVQSPRFSLLVNGESCGFFQGKRGLRQGDPMSPLLFVIRMEYLTRTLKLVGSNPLFRFHPKCKGLQLNHLCFADDVILCCRGENRSVYMMLQGFKYFSAVSGLDVNESKSEIYTTGMDQVEVIRITEASGFKVGKIPFKYLGVPFSLRRLSAKDCMILVDKMTARVRCWSSRNFSYQGRLVLVNAVLTSIHVYWAQICILPRRVLKDIEMICRAYLWTGDYYSSKGGYVAWPKVCIPKYAGGLGIRNITSGMWQLWEDTLGLSLQKKITSG